MKVSELIEQLQAQPPDTEVWIVYDGAARQYAAAAWMTQGGDVAIGPRHETIYEDEDRAIGAPSSKAMPYLNVSDMLNLPPEE